MILRNKWFIAGGQHTSHRIELCVVGETGKGKGQGKNSDGLNHGISTLEWCGQLESHKIFDCSAKLFDIVYMRVFKQGPKRGSR